MSLVRYSPLGINQLQSEINRIFRSFDDSESSSATADWVPTVDINEFDDRFQLFVDLPGVDPEQVDITLDNGVLTISGERRPEALAEGEKRLQRRIERGEGRFYRRFILPDMVDADNVEARNRFGVLEITIPKQAKAQPRRITIAA
jgi:HSP20 family protein